MEHRRATAMSGWPASRSGLRLMKLFQTKRSDALIVRFERETCGAKPGPPAAADFGSRIQAPTKEALIEQIIHHRCMRYLPDLFDDDIIIRAGQRDYTDEGRRCPDRMH
jgi:hypothetical protein